ncbi:MAG: hypothetical protein KME16_21350 [Scytolyngbya sp. HA4215-MV1]|jgi:hypothetical protein|nr:hypothetical protein [Scytolyngbya sp. HA4215-MV1]
MDRTPFSLTQFSGLAIPVFAAVIQFSEVMSFVLPSVEMPNPWQGRSSSLISSVAISQPMPHSSSEGSPSPASLTYAYPTFNSKQFDRQLKLYLEYQAAFGTPEILIVGSSRALQGIDPITLQQALAQRNYPNLRVFNFGINGATAQVVNLLIQRILTPDQLPRLIVWADGSRAFNSGRLDITYNGIVASKGYKLLSSGIRPTLPPAEQKRICIEALPEHFADRATSRFSQPAPAQTGAVGQTLTTNQDLTINQDLTANQDLTTNQDPSSNFAPADRQPSPNPAPLALPTPGIQELLCDAANPFLHQFSPFYSLPAPSLDARKAGLQLVTLRFEPATYYQRYSWVSGQYDSDYQNFNLQGQQTLALDRVLSFTQAKNIPVVFVNLPLTESYLDWTRQDYENAFWRYMANFSRQKRLIFRDISRHPQLSRNENFADPSHMNRFGAIAIGKYLAQDPGIPWHRVLVRRELE